MTITKEMSIMEVVTNYPDTVPVFMQAGMGCIGCAGCLLEQPGDVTSLDEGTQWLHRRRCCTLREHRAGRHGSRHRH